MGTVFWIKDCTLQISVPIHPLPSLSFFSLLGDFCEVSVKMTVFCLPFFVTGSVIPSLLRKHFLRPKERFASKAKYSQKCTVIAFWNGSECEYAVFFYQVFWWWSFMAQCWCIGSNIWWKQWIRNSSNCRPTCARAQVPIQVIRWFSLSGLFSMY